jgi:hypothetical protein
MIEFNKEGFNPTAGFIEDLHTGTFRELVSNILIIKGAKNDRGFDQAYGILNGKKELLLIDAVEEAYDEAIQNLVSNGYKIRAILITGKKVLDDCFKGLEALSKDAGDADIYLHPEIAPQDFETKSLTQRDAVLSHFDIEPYAVPGKNGQVVLYTNKHNGIIFAGESAIGADYDVEDDQFSRETESNDNDARALEKFWNGFRNDFDYFFTRKGKPAIEFDGPARVALLDGLAQN